MGNSLRLACLFGIALVLTSHGAMAGYVFYYRTFGDWTVACWSTDAMRQHPDSIAGSKSCSLAAPPPRLEDTIPHSPGSTVVTVTETSRANFVISFKVRDVLAPRQPFSILVDDTARLSVLPSKHGEFAIGQADITPLMATLDKGTRLTLQSVLANGARRSEDISLDGFADALRTYRGLIRQHGLLAQP